MRIFNKNDISYDSLKIWQRGLNSRKFGIIFLEAAIASKLQRL